AGGGAGADHVAAAVDLDGAARLGRARDNVAGGVHRHRLAGGGNLGRRRGDTVLGDRGGGRGRGHVAGGFPRGDREAVDGFLGLADPDALPTAAGGGAGAHHVAAAVGLDGAAWLGRARDGVAGRVHRQRVAGGG